MSLTCLVIRGLTEKTRKTRTITYDKKLHDLDITELIYRKTSNRSLVWSPTQVGYLSDAKL